MQLELLLNHTNSHFKYLNLSNHIENIMLDIRNEDLVAKELKELNQTMFFITVSYSNNITGPVLWTTNLNGTINIQWVT